MNDQGEPRPATNESLPFDEDTLIALPSPNPEDPVDRADVIGEGAEPRRAA